MREVIEAAEAVYDRRTLGGLLHMALRSRCLAVLDLLLGLSEHGCVPLGCVPSHAQSAHSQHLPVSTCLLRHMRSHHVRRHPPR